MKKETKKSKQIELMYQVSKDFVHFTEKTLVPGSSISLDELKEINKKVEKMFNKALQKIRYIEHKNQ